MVCNKITQAEIQSTGCSKCCKSLRIWHTK